ncbi:MAG: hypothetical protein ABFC84_16805 [Veillonellales bacterium]
MSKQTKGRKKRDWPKAPYNQLMKSLEKRSVVCAVISQLSKKDKRYVFEYCKFEQLKGRGVNKKILYKDDFCFGHKERTGTWITNGICNDCGKPIASKKTEYSNSGYVIRDSPIQVTNAEGENEL